MAFVETEMKLLITQYANAANLYKMNKNGTRQVEKVIY